MTFTKRQVAEFKAKCRFYTTWRKNLKPYQIKKAFYNGYRNVDLKVLYPDKNLDYCSCYMYDIVIGDYKLGLKYVDENGTYYMFLSANSFFAYPQNVAIGRAIAGKVYLVCEHFPNGGNDLNFRVILEDYIDRKERGFRPKSYNHSISVFPSSIEREVKNITDEDIKCLKIAYQGIKAFSKLIEEIC